MRMGVRRDVQIARAVVAMMLLVGAVPAIVQGGEHPERMDQTTLPVTFPYTSVLGHVVVDVGVGGDPPAPFMFDTGAPTFVSSTLAQAHGGAVLDEVRIMAGGDTIISNPLQVVDSMRVGGAVETRRPGCCRPGLRRTRSTASARMASSVRTSSPMRYGRSTTAPNR